MSLTTDTLTSFSKNANLVASGGSSPIITAPVLQGMGFVTAIYKDATPYIDSSVFFNTIIPVSSPAIAATKYKLLLDDSKTWLLYATAANDSGLALTSTSTSRLEARDRLLDTSRLRRILMMTLHKKRCMIVVLGLIQRQQPCLLQ